MSVVALLERLAPHIEREVNLAINSKQEAEGLSSKLNKVQVGLRDAERKGATDQSVKDWLKELEDVMFDMEDALDEWEALDLSQQFAEGSRDITWSASNPWEKVRSVVLSICSCFQHAFWERREVVLKMKALSERLDKILDDKNKYNFVQCESNHNRCEEISRVESTGLLDCSRLLLGRDFDQESLVRVLVPEKGEECAIETQIISIVGIGGVGKTTLAQMAYNHPVVKAHFELRAWAFVGDPFDPKKVAHAILEGVDKEKSELNKPSTLHAIEERIKSVVSQKKLLVVLDDVWTEESRKWEELKKCLIIGAPGSKILVTTRNEAVARMMGTTHWQPLGLLCDKDCGTILNGVALKGRSEEKQKELEDIGMEIAKKCNGLPLAAKTVGSMLALKFTKQEWLCVLDSPLWKYENEVSDLFRLLKMSYLDLDPILRGCFLSCILYSKGYRIPLCELVRRWVGYGYISSSIPEDEVQLVGLQYFQKLEMRSFIEKLHDDDDDDGVIRFKVHDIMHDFATYMSEREQISCLINERNRSNEMRSSSYNKQAQHKNFSGQNSLERLRSVSAKSVSLGELPTNLFSLLKCVRVLTVLGCNLREVPPEIGKLIHLRFLDLSWNLFKELPTTVTNLYNLQTLDVQGCVQLLRLPQGIEKLTKLRHLLNRKTPNLKEFPQGLQKLTGLCTLNRFYVGEEGSSKLGWLENLNQLRGKLTITIGADDVEDAEKANLRMKNHIRYLSLKFEESVRMEVILAALQPHPAIETLKISGYGGKWFPSWLVNSTKSLASLKELNIDGFDEYALPPLANLSCLEKLYISDMKFKLLTCEFLGIDSSAASPSGSTTSALFSGGFPKLKTLGFYYCELWEEWEDIGDSEVSVPCLKELAFVNCNKLKGLPHNLLRGAKSLTHLLIWKSELLESRYDPNTGSDWEKVSHIPNFQVYEDEENEEEEEDEDEEGEDEEEDK